MPKQSDKASVAGQASSAARTRDTPSSDRATVLHVDDDPNDTALLQAATLKACVGFDLENVEDGDKAIAYLSGADKYADRNRYRVPSMVLLDLKMPRATGFEILKWIRQHPTFRRMTVIVLSGSESQDDITHAYDAGADSYLIKPLGFEALVKLVHRINEIWMRASGKPA